MRESADVKPEIRYDNYNHWVEFDKKYSRTRCKMDGCKKSTHAFCTKCEIHLCSSVNYNCFRSFHTLKKEEKVNVKKTVKQPKQMRLKNTGAKPVDNTKRSSHRRKSINNRSGSRIVTSPNTPRFKTNIDNLTHKNPSNKAHRKQDPCQEFGYLSEPSDEEDAETPKIRFVNFTSIHNDTAIKSEIECPEIEFIDMDN
ncbi:uncharacterized protein LOC116342086 [Contarinia nasturtii]|uniref:uncharacterized protein LOC116342086 n=1 Tax=Contarinia nasturtii TaxID=265458 RepID=UPI0012D42EC3|nr:uncharacterized protein LOC116342086 [Contarinia nasturtii]